jgi:hypothetical protein
LRRNPAGRLVFDCRLLTKATVGTPTGVAPPYAALTTAGALNWQRAARGDRRLGVQESAIRRRNGRASSALAFRVRNVQRARRAQRHPQRARQPLATTLNDAARGLS